MSAKPRPDGGGLVFRPLLFTPLVAYSTRESRAYELLPVVARPTVI